MGLLTPTITALSFIASIITVGAYGRAKRQEFRELRRGRVKSVVNRGFDYHKEGPTGRADLHNYAIQYHSSDIENHATELRFVNKSYFDDRVGGYFDTELSEKEGQFPTLSARIG